MKITIDGWKSQGLRCPDVSVNLLSGDQHKKVSLIQMPNGTGKTTTLKLIRSSLTGEAQTWDRNEISELRSLKTPDISSGKFLLELSVDGKPLVFESLIDFVEGKVKYKTSSPLLGGVVDGWSPPTQIKRFLEEKFVSLFIFDGEFAANLLDPRKTKATEAIETLSQLDLLDEIVSEAENLWDKQRREVAGTSVSFLNTLKEREKKLKHQLSELEKLRKKLKANNDLYEQELNRINTQIEDKIGENENIKAERERLLQLKNTAESLLKQALESYMHELRFPHQLYSGFTKNLEDFKYSLDKAKLPQRSSKQFFIELAEDKTCVCGRPIGPNEKSHILNNSEYYLSEDISTVLNMLKEDIKQYSTKRDNEESIDTIESRLKDAYSEHHKSVTHFNKNELKIRNLQDKAYDTLLNERDKFTSDLRDNQNLLKQINLPFKNTDDENTLSINSLEIQLKDTQGRIAEVTDTVELRERVNILKNIASNAKAIAKEALHKQLIAECNERLSKVLVNSPLQIEDIDNHIKLKGQAAGSVGQTLAVAYIFLTVALHRGSHQFPLVVDSPAGSLEELVRSEVGKVIPELCEQFISFIIDTEKLGFVPALESASKNSISFSTIFRLNETSNRLLQSTPTNDVQISGDSVLVNGKDFFVKFTLAQE